MCLTGTKTTNGIMAIAEKEFRSKRAHVRNILGSPAPSQEMELMGSHPVPPVSPAMYSARETDSLGYLTLFSFIIYTHTRLMATIRAEL